MGMFRCDTCGSQDHVVRFTLIGHASIHLCPICVDGLLVRCDECTGQLFEIDARTVCPVCRDALSTAPIGAGKE